MRWRLSKYLDSIGGLLRPTKKGIGLEAGLNANDVRAALDAQVRAVTGKVPAEVMAKILSIRQTI